MAYMPSSGVVEAQGKKEQKQEAFPHPYGGCKKRKMRRASFPGRLWGGEVMCHFHLLVKGRAMPGEGLFIYLLT